MGLVAVLLLAVAGGPIALKAVHDTDLTAALAWQHELANTSEDRNSPYNVRVYEVETSINECDGLISTCPDVDLYVAVVETDLGSEPALYRLPRAKGWEFVRWSATCPSVGGEPQVGLAVRTSLPDVGYIDPDESRKWSTTVYELCVSPRVASFSKKLQNHRVQRTEPAPSSGASGSKGQSRGPSR